MSNSFSRNVKYIIYFALKIFGLVIGILAAFVLFDLLSSGNFENVIQRELDFMIFYPLFGLFAFNVRLYMQDMRVALSFCSRRKDYYFAKITVSILIIVIYMIVAMVLSAFVGNLTVKNILGILSVTVLVLSLSIICGIALMKLGMLGYLIFVCSCGFGAGLVVSFSGFELFTNGWILIPVMAILIIAALIEWKTVSNYEVRI